jgi:hypothetical protein
LCHDLCGPVLFHVASSFFGYKYYAHWARKRLTITGNNLHHEMENGFDDMTDKSAEY